MNDRGPDPVRVALVWVAAVAWAGLVAWLLGRGLAPALPSVPVSDLLSGDALDRARGFRGALRVLALLSQAAVLAALVILALQRRLPSPGQAARLSARPVLGGAIVGVGLAIVLYLVRPPFGFGSWRVGSDYGLLTLDFGTWALDGLKGLLISVLVLGLAGAAGTWGWARFARFLWVAASVVLGAFAVVWIWIWPVVVSPLFNRVEPLPEGPARASLERIAAEAGVEVEGVFTEAASRRTRAVNAYVHGLGPSRRVVIQDTALERLDPGQTEVLVAHELAHVEYRDPERGLLFALLVIPPAALAVQMLALLLVRRRGDGSPGPLVIPPLALGVAVASLLISVPGSWLSRQVEARADQRSLELTLDPQAAISLQRTLTRTNLQDPAPPPAWTALFGTHPPAVQRVGLARAFDSDLAGGGQAR
ncbi:MAG: M48 family metalloprotease [Solirubrobacterales bacterium]